MVAKGHVGFMMYLPLFVCSFQLLDWAYDSAKSCFCETLVDHKPRRSGHWFHDLPTHVAKVRKQRKGHF